MAANVNYPSPFILAVCLLTASSAFSDDPQAVVDDYTSRSGFYTRQLGNDSLSTIETTPRTSFRDSTLNDLRARPVRPKFAPIEPTFKGVSIPPVRTEPAVPDYRLRRENRLDESLNSRGYSRRGNYLGQLGGNEFDPNSTRNPLGAGNSLNPNSINNDFGKYGSKFSPTSPRNPYATNTPKLYDDEGKYRGKLSTNPYDPDSISNPFGRYGNPYSSDSIKNRFGAGNPFSTNSPSNPFGRGLSIYADK